LNPQRNRERIFRAGESEGKSGGFFFFSKDRRFLIKTIPEIEVIAFLKILNQYYNHLKNHKSSLLGRIYGLFKIKLKNLSSVNIVLMQNILRFQKKSVNEADILEFFRNL
jgi:hypothetical protein